MWVRLVDYASVFVPLQPSSNSHPLCVKTKYVDPYIWLAYQWNCFRDTLNG